MLRNRRHLIQLASDAKQTEQAQGLGGAEEVKGSYI
jgi:hypothetical protein